MADSPSPVYQRFVLPLPDGVKHTEVWTERRGDEHLLLFNGTKGQLLNFIGRALDAAEDQ